MEEQQQQQEAAGGGGGVRVVARICPCPPPPPDAATTTTLHFQVAALNSSALISFLPRRPITSAAVSSGRGDGPKDKQQQQQYRLDGCYLKDDPNHRIFHNEIKPLIDGRGGGGGGRGGAGAKACVVACGDAAAKHHLFMGSPDQPGLFTMAMAQLLDSSRDIGAAVTVSSYQVLQDTHILDLLEPKNHEVLILEDADGQTHLKGLSRVSVKSIEEFSRLSCCATNQQIHHPAKDSTQLQDWGHQGLIIYVSSFDQHGKECALAKINFLNLAGYVDPKQKKNEGLALPTGNKSMHALMNVVQALNSNQRFVPYRQSKVTRILQDSLCKSKTSGAVLIACLAEDCCQDAISTLGLASRSSQVVNEQYYSLSLSAKKTTKSNMNLPTDAKTLSRTVMHKTMLTQEKNARPGFNNSGVKGGQIPTANRRTQPIISSTKKSGSSIFTSIKMKENYAKPKISGRKLFCPSINSLKEEDAMDVASTVVTQTKSTTAIIQAEEVQPSVGMEIRAAIANGGSDETGNTGDVKSSEMQDVVHCSTQELLPSTIQEEDYALSNMQPEHSCTDMGLTCSSITGPALPDKLVEKSPASSTQSSPKLSDRLREISNSLKLLRTRQVSVRAQKLDKECVWRINTIAPEPTTPEVILKFEQAEDPKDKLTARSTGIKKSLVQECLTFLNSANKEQLKSLKGIGEKRANYILELREQSPELFKEISDLRDIIGMNSKEIKKMMSGIIDS